MQPKAGQENGLGTIFYCLRFETFPFVVSYDLQSYGEGAARKENTFVSYISVARGMRVFIPRCVEDHVFILK
jgi:hypothetical protein